MALRYRCFREFQFNEKFLAKLLYTLHQQTSLDSTQNFELGWRAVFLPNLPKDTRYSCHPSFLPHWVWSVAEVMSTFIVANVLELLCSHIFSRIKECGCPGFFKVQEILWRLYFEQCAIGSGEAFGVFHQAALTAEVHWSVDIWGQFTHAVLLDAEKVNPFLQSY